MKRYSNQFYWVPIPNNPRDNELYVDKMERNRERKFNKTKMLFGSTEKDKVRVLKRLQEVYGSRRTAGGAWVPRDEPTEPQRTQHLKVDKKQFAKDLEVWKTRTKQAVARERLKKKGAVPTKSGKRLFEDFCRIAYSKRNTESQEPYSLQMQ